jgi:hypothetical protein
MSIDNMDKIFRPESIAVVGASERKGSVGAALMHNLIERGFAGEIHPINPLFINEKNACAIDARVLLKPPDKPHPIIWSSVPIRINLKNILEPVWA